MADDKLPTKEDLEKLPRWAVVAFAARCAKRVLPLIEHFRPDVPKVHVEHVVKAVRFAEQSASCGHFNSKLWADTNRAMKDSYSAPYSSAKEVLCPWDKSFDTIKSGSDVYALRSIASTATHFRNIESHTTQEAAQITSLANKAIVAASDTFPGQYASMAAFKAMIHDYQHLLTTSKTEGWKDNTPVPPEFFGPLWPEGEPKGWPNPSRKAEVKSAQSDASQKRNSVLRRLAFRSVSAFIISVSTAIGAHFGGWLCGVIVFSVGAGIAGVVDQTGSGNDSASG